MQTDNQLTSVLLARREILAAQSAAQREYRDRIRKLTAAADAIISSTVSVEGEMLDGTSGVTLSPEIQGLIKNPLNGL